MKKPNKQIFVIFPACQGCFEMKMNFVSTLPLKDKLSLMSK